MRNHFVMHFIIHTTDMLPDSILLGGYQTIPWVKMLTWLLILLARVLANVWASILDAWRCELLRPCFSGDVVVPNWRLQPPQKA